MGFLNIFPRPQKVLPDSDFADLTTAIVIYQHDEEFAEPGMPDPVVPVLSGRTSEQKTCRDLPTPPDHDLNSGDLRGMLGLK